MRPGQTVAAGSRCSRRRLLQARVERAGGGSRIRPASWRRRPRSRQQGGRHQRHHPAAAATREHDRRQRHRLPRAHGLGAQHHALGGGAGRVRAQRQSAQQQYKESARPAHRPQWLRGFSHGGRGPSGAHSAAAHKASADKTTHHRCAA
eukprot:scaffold1770_cov375-Prasinococcus_capsulatus_cf.AAC.27